MGGGCEEHIGECGGRQGGEVELVFVVMHAFGAQIFDLRSCTKIHSYSAEKMVPAFNGAAPILSSR